MLRDAVALIAKDAIRIQIILEPFKANVVVRELLLEILKRVLLRLRAFGLGCLVLIGCSSLPTEKYNRFHTYSQGIITKVCTSMRNVRRNNSFKV